MANGRQQTPEQVEWSVLIEEAGNAMSHAYAPYSRFKVGAAGLTTTGTIVSGCNVENASYGLGLCAECGLVSSLHGTGGGKLIAMVCVDQHKDVLMPCGRCRQLLLEHAAPGFVIMTPLGVRTMTEILPQPFVPEDLDNRAEERTNG
ncbi:MAG: hypothetical protein RIQ64_1712 [Actinomycetota bacterium]|jgi:cytidine deaminase